MGDATVFLMAVEETFGVEILDQEAEQMRTFGELAEWLSSRLRQRIAPLETAPCLNVYAFNRVRRALGSATKVRPQTPLDDLLPPHQQCQQRRAQWSQLRAQGLPVPSLQWAPRLKTTLETLWFAAAATSSIPAMFIAFNSPQVDSYFLWWLLPLVFGFAAYFLILGAITKSVHHLLGPLKIYAPQPTVGELARHLANQNYWQLAAQRGNWSEAEMWRVLQKLSAREAEVEPSEVQRDTPILELLSYD